MSSEPKLAVDRSRPEKGKAQFLSMSPPSIVYWSRVAFALAAGVVYNLTGLDTQGLATGTASAIGIGIGVYAVSVFAVKNILRYGEAELKGPRKHISLGLGSYVIWFIFTIILLNTILHPLPA